MIVKKTGRAGSVESNDILVLVETSDSGIEIELQSIVINQFGSQIKKTIEDTIKAMKIENVKVSAMDRGALDFVIKSRTETALLRACEMENESW